MRVLEECHASNTSQEECRGRRRWREACFRLIYEVIDMEKHTQTRTFVCLQIWKHTHKHVHLCAFRCLIRYSPCLSFDICVVVLDG